MRKHDFSHLRNEEFMFNIISDSLPERYNVMRRESERDRRWIAEIARSYGVNPEAASYFPQLARFPGDPEAFVTSRSEIRKLLEKRGWSASGIVEYEAKKERSAGPYEVSDDIVENHFSQMYSEEEIREMRPEDVAEKKNELKKRLSGGGDVSDVQ